MENYDQRVGQRKEMNEQNRTERREAEKYF